MLLIYSHLHNKIIKQSLSPDKQTAKALSTKITDAINKAITYIQLGLESELIDTTLSILNGAPKVAKKLLPVDIIPAATISTYTFEDKALEYIATLTLSDSKHTEYQSMRKMLILLLPQSLHEIEFKKLDKVVSTLKVIPKRTKQVYRAMSLMKLISIKAPMEDRLTNKSINEYINFLKAILNFCSIRGYIDKDLSKAIKPLKITNLVKTKRDMLSDDTIKALLPSLTNEQQILFQALRYSGMRPSELLQCTIHKIEGIYCFDLTADDIQVKTNTSKRVIPIHSQILNKVEELKVIITSTKNINSLSRKVTNELRKLGLPNTSTLYSLRHTFITTLINHNVDVNVVSSLAGHSLQGNKMTLGVYFKGYDISKLKEAIELL